MKALAVVIVFGIAAHAALPYLPIVGAPAMRMLTARDAHFANIVKLDATGDKSTNNQLADLESAALSGTNLLQGETVNHLAESPLPVIQIGAGTELEGTLGTSIFTLATPDLMGVTPQMLAVYLQRGIGTNTAQPGLGRIGFMPPGGWKEKANQAEEKVK